MYVYKEEQIDLFNTARLYIFPRPSRTSNMNARGYCIIIICGRVRHVGVKDVSVHEHGLETLNYPSGTKKLNEVRGQKLFFKNDL